MGLLRKIKKSLLSTPPPDTDKVISCQDEEFDIVANVNQVASFTDTAPEEVKSLPYYHGYLPRRDAADVVVRVGDFLIRRTDLNENKSAFMLTIRIEKSGQDDVDHVHIPYCEKTGKWMVGTTEQYDSLGTFITKYMKAGHSVMADDDRYKLKYGVPRQNWQLPHSRVVRLKKVGSGAYGEVWKGYIKIDETRFLECAIKCLPTGMVTTTENREEFIKEARVCRQLQHENIVKFRGIAIDEEPIMMMLEWCELGSLLSFMKQPEEYSMAEHIRWCIEASQGLRYLEKNNVIHRDVAARNCLLNADFHVKVADFGLSQKSRFYKETHNIKMPLRWLAPESLINNVFSNKSDVWSFGVFMSEVFSNGKEPYSNLTPREVGIGVMINKVKLTPPESMPPGCVTLMNSCLERDPNKRPTFLDLKLKLRKELVKCNEACAKSGKSSSRSPSRSPSPLSRKSSESKSSCYSISKSLNLPGYT